MVFKAEKHFSSGTRKYSEIHWSDFWWETQVISLNIHCLMDDYVFILYLRIVE